MKMGIKEVAKLLTLVGLDIKLGHTNSYDWERLFVTLDGLSLGRISFHHDTVYSVKWYGQTRYDINTHAYYYEAVTVLMNIGVVLPQEAFAVMVQRAKDASVNSKAEKEKARALLPTHSSSGKRINRRLILGKSPQAFLRGYVDEFIEAFEINGHASINEGPK
jgi:hypothetical protein